MKKILFVVLALGLVAMINAATTVYAPKKANGTSIDLTSSASFDTLILHSLNTAETKDTFAAAKIHIYGVYPLASGMSRGGYSSFTVYADTINGTSPTASFDYQLTPGLTLADTCTKSTTGWTVLDTLDGSGFATRADISAKDAKGIVFRINNYDGTATQVIGKVIVVLKRNETWNVNR